VHNQYAISWTRRGERKGHCKKRPLGDQGEGVLSESEQLDVSTDLKPGKDANWGNRDKGPVQSAPRDLVM